MAEKNTSYYTTRPKLVAYLIGRGFKPEKIPNVYDLSKCAWVFNKNEALMNAIEEYYGGQSND